MLGAYITVGILVAALLLVGYAIFQPRLRKYRLILKRVDEHKKKRRAKPAKKKKSVWIRIV
jgi:hypothetical protein